MRGCALLLEGEVLSPLLIASVQMMKKLAGIEGPAGPDQVVESMMIAADRGDHQDGVRLVCIERTERDVGDLEVLDGLAALELQVALRIELMRRVRRAVGRNGGDQADSEAGSPMQDV
jgi:hypothetical protein